MTNVRRAQPRDAEALSELGGVTFTQTFGHLYNSKDLNYFLNKSHSVKAYTDILADPSFAVWIAEADDGKKIGYSVAGPCGLPVPNLPVNSGELVRLYLREDATGAGLGAKLLEPALDYLRAQFEHVYLSVYAENPRAQRLYQRFGFVKIHDYFYMVGEQADPEWIMELRPS